MSISLKKHNAPITMEDQKAKDDIAVALSTLMGAKVVPHADFEKLSNRNKELWDRVKNNEGLEIKLCHTLFKLQAFVNYHSKWKPTTRKFETRLKNLQKENLYLDFQDYPLEISENLKEAYQCYLNGLKMSAYIMILRTLEIAVNILYTQKNRIKRNKDGKPIFVSAMMKLNWAKEKKFIAGADYTIAKGFIEARNDAVHDNIVPTEKQLMSAFETAIILIKKLKPQKK